MSDVDHGVPAARVITARTLANVLILGQNKNLIEAGKLPTITVISGNPPLSRRRTFKRGRRRHERCALPRLTATPSGSPCRHAARPMSTALCFGGAALA